MADHRHQIQQRRGGVDLAVHPRMLTLAGWLFLLSPRRVAFGTVALPVLRAARCLGQVTLQHELET